MIARPAVIRTGNAQLHPRRRHAARIQQRLYVLAVLRIAHTHQQALARTDSTGNLDIDRFDFGQEGPPVALVVWPGQQHAVLGLPLRGQAARGGVLAAVHGISW